MIKNTIGLIPRYNWDYNFSDLCRAIIGSFKPEQDDLVKIENEFGMKPVLTTSGRTSLYTILKALKLSMEALGVWRRGKALTQSMPPLIEGRQRQGKE